MSKRKKLEGSNIREVQVVLYNPDWPAAFEQAAAEIEELLAGCLAVHHIGSTAVPGLAAKPIIDLLVVVDQIEAVDSFNERFRRLGYEPKGENGLPGRRYFERGGNLRTHHVHCYGQGNPEIDRHLLFRDYLRNHPAEAAAYGELKLELAKKHPLDIDRYIAGKNAMVQAIEKQAIGEI